jgi:uncharacterized protein YjiS (DUF1127 family)
MSNRKKTRAQRLRQTLKNGKYYQKVQASQELARLEERQIDAVLEGHQVKES